MKIHLEEMQLWYKISMDKFEKELPSFGVGNEI